MHIGPRGGHDGVGVGALAVHHLAVLLQPHRGLGLGVGAFGYRADRKKVVFDEDIVALVDDEVMRDHERIKFVSLDLHAGSKAPPRAELELDVDGEVKRAAVTGDGPVDAVLNRPRP